MTNSNIKALIIEDDENIIASLKLALGMRWPGIELLSSRLGEEGLTIAENKQPDIIILDLGLPDINGFQVLKQLRLFSEVPVIILTVLGDEDDVVRGLELGANDYIIKPFRKLEFLARVNSLLRKQAIVEEALTFERGPFSLTCSNHTLCYRDKAIMLTKSECLIFYKLLANAGTVVSYATLAKELWGDDYPGSIEAIRVYIQRLRNKIKKFDALSNIIETEIGLGYILHLPAK